jgi:hypothetical protein
LKLLIRSSDIYNWEAELSLCGRIKIYKDINSLCQDKQGWCKRNGYKYGTCLNIEQGGAWEKYLETGVAQMTS